MIRILTFILRLNKPSSNGDCRIDRTNLDELKKRTYIFEQTIKRLSINE